MSNAPPTPHACCPFCTDTPIWRRPGRSRAPHPAVCRRCGAEFIASAAGSVVVRPPTGTPAAA